MRNVAKVTEKERKALFQNTAAKMGLTNAVIEKDFWVCYMLDYLFHRCEWKKHIAFKGGTSLSKAYKLIERFSEDIDLILDWRVIGLGMNEPWEERSSTKQDLFNKEVNRLTEVFLKDTFMPGIIGDLSEELRVPVNCYIEESDPQTVVFAVMSSIFRKFISLKNEVVCRGYRKGAEFRHLQPNKKQSHSGCFLFGK